MMVIEIECGYYPEGFRKVEFKSSDFVNTNNQRKLKQESAFRALFELDIIPDDATQDEVDSYYDACLGIKPNELIDIIGERLGECHIIIRE